MIRVGEKIVSNIILSLKSTNTVRNDKLGINLPPEYVYLYGVRFNIRYPYVTKPSITINPVNINLVLLGFLPAAPFTNNSTCIMWNESEYNFVSSIAESHEYNSKSNALGDYEPNLIKVASKIPLQYKDIDDILNNDSSEYSISNISIFEIV